MNVHHSSKFHGYGTPAYVYEPLHREFRFDLDVCAEPHTAKCPRYFTKEQDALALEWRGRCWMNPPYGRGPEGLPGFIDKAIQESRKLYGQIVVALVPARTDTAWFKRCVLYAHEIRFVAGRIKFEGMDNGAPFPSAVIVFNRHVADLDAGPAVSWIEF